MSGIDDYDSDIFEAIEELVAEGELEVGTKAHGLALKVVDDGYDSLTPKQRYVYDTQALPLIESKLKEWQANQLSNSAGD